MKRAWGLFLAVCILVIMEFSVSATEEIIYPWMIDEQLQSADTLEEKLSLLEKLVSDPEFLYTEKEFALTEAGYCRDLLDAYFMVARPAAQTGGYSQVAYLTEELNAFEKQRAENWVFSDEKQGIRTTRVFGIYEIEHVREQPDDTIQLILTERQYVVYCTMDDRSDESIYQWRTPHVVTLKKGEEWYIESDAYCDRYMPLCSPDYIGCGDWNLDGAVNTTDARMALQIAADIPVNEIAIVQYALDVNGDGKVNTTDARLILQYAAGRITAFSAAT